MIPGVCIILCQRLLHSSSPISLQRRHVSVMDYQIIGSLTNCLTTIQMLQLCHDVMTSSWFHPRPPDWAVGEAFRSVFKVFIAGKLPLANFPRICFLFYDDWVQTVLTGRYSLGWRHPICMVPQTFIASRNIHLNFALKTRGFEKHDKFHSFCMDINLLARGDAVVILKS